VIAPERLLLCAGPPGVGKTSFISAIRSGRHPDLDAALGLGGAGSWSALDAYEVPGAAQRRCERVILHYDIYKPIARGGEWSTDPPLEVLGAAGTAAILTLWAPREVLIERWPSKRRGLVRDGLLALGRGRLAEGARALRRARRGPRLPDTLELYERWLSFCAGTGVRSHQILDTTAAPPVLHPATSPPWRQSRSIHA